MKKENVKILLVDDEPDIVEIIRYNLKQEGYKVYTASNGIDALKISKKELPHLIILDVMMPMMDGIETCEKIRQDMRLQETIIMFLTARGEDYSYLAAFDAGADDYVTKPIKPKVLISKVKGLLRRLNSNEKQTTIIEIDTLRIDRETYRVNIGEKELSLPRKEFELLFLLASDPKKVFKREQIMEKVWGSEVVVGDRTIDVHIRKLREKFGGHYFETVKGVGYKFIPPKKL